MGVSFLFFSANRKTYTYLPCFSLHVDILCLLFNSYVNIIVYLRFNKVNVLFYSKNVFINSFVRHDSFLGSTTEMS